MGANSNHYVDLIKWVERVIDSCTTQRQLRYCENLIMNLDWYLTKKTNLSVREIQPIIRELFIKTIKPEITKL